MRICVILHGLKQHKTMKKFILSLIAAAAISANANAQGQTSFTGTKPLDNWSIGVQAGAVAPIGGKLSVFPNSRGIFGINLNKQFSPIYGLTIEGTLGVNTSSWSRDIEDNPMTVKSNTWFDNSSVLLLNRINLNNLFCGWNGGKSCFEVEAVAGAGWYRYIYDKAAAIGTDSHASQDYNTAVAKFGLNFNYNIGKEKAWTVALKPAIVFDLIHNQIHNMEFDKRNAMVELTAGVVYHFKNSNGKRYMTEVGVMTPEELGALNARIKEAQDGRTRAEADANAMKEENARLKKLLTECMNRPVQQTTVVDNSKKTLESTVTFRVGSTAIDASQQPNVERIASYLKKHVEANVEIKGYASPDGPEDVNIKLANSRAQAVKDMLVNKYGVPASRIKAEGQGIGNMFEENDWNRVSICTIGE